MSGTAYYRNYEKKLQEIRLNVILQKYGYELGIPLRFLSTSLSTEWPRNKYLKITNKKNSDNILKSLYLLNYNV